MVRAVDDNPGEPLPAIVRAYTPHRSKPGASGGIEPSEWSLVFDCETTSDTVHALRFGAFQVRWRDFLQDVGLFYDPARTTEQELTVLQAAAATQGLDLLKLDEFIDQVFFRYVYDLSGICIGFNLPFDISRIARGHVVSASRDAFSFDLSETRRKIRVRIRQRNGRARIEFVTRGSRQPSDHAGHFSDVSMLGRALTGTHHSLKTLAKTLDTDHQKIETSHGERLDPEYIGYCVNDVQVTWECFEALGDRYDSYQLAQTPITRVVSEASIGKAALREIGVKPFREVQPDFPAPVLGRIMSTYYGGRSEVRLRRQLAEVIYCDFLSMYTTCCANLGLWEFVIAQGMDYRDTTEETQAFLEQVTLSDLQDPATWKRLAVIVEMAPDHDRLPLRAEYAPQVGDKRAGIPEPAPGISNCYVSSTEETLTYTLMDCIASKLDTGRAPTVVRATAFAPRAPQPGLQPIDVAGNPDYRVDPYVDDYYRKLIELRNDVKKRAKAARAAGDNALARRLDAEQQGLKITASSTSYGALIELNVEALAEPKITDAYGQHGPFFTKVDRVEKPGRYFHPLPATLITGAARLMLAIAEQLAYQHDLDWAFMDTDSIAFTNPNGLPTDEYRERVELIRSWFQPLNPYQNGGELLELEDVNYGLNPDGTSSTEPRELICYAVSPKRYELFNLDPLWRPIIRKASAHGLGYLIAPYRANGARTRIPAPAVELHELGVERWQYDLWHLVASAAVHERKPNLQQLPGLDQPAMMSHSITTPTVETWFADSNRGCDYAASLRPFGFFMAPLVAPLGRPLGKAYAPFKLIAPLDTEPAAWLETDFIDIYSKETYSLSTMHFDIRTAKAKTYRQIIEKYLTHPDARRLDRAGNKCTRETVGYLDPIHVDAFHIEYTGKEADGLDEADPAACEGHRRYLRSEDPSQDPFRRWVLPVLRRIGPTALARETGISISAIVEILGDRSSPHARTKTKLTIAAVRHATRKLQQIGAAVPRDSLARLYTVARAANAERSAGHRPR